MRVYDVAPATRQFDNTDLIGGGPSNLDARDHVWFFGGFIGLLVTW